MIRCLKEKKKFQKKLHNSKYDEKFQSIIYLNVIIINF